MMLLGTVRFRITRAWWVTPAMEIGLTVLPVLGTIAPEWADRLSARLIDVLVARGIRVMIL